MRRTASIAVAAMVMGVVSSVPAAAAPPSVEAEPFWFGFPDADNGLAVFVNIERDTVCTAAQVAFEEAVLAWLEGGLVGEPPEEPDPVDGIEPVPVRILESGKGALVGHIATDLYIEIWTLDSPGNAPMVGPCTDTDDEGAFFAAGTVSYRANDNDLDVSETRGSAFGDRGHALVESADGTEYSYSWTFHLNDRCYLPAAAPPACLIENGRLRELP